LVEEFRDDHRYSHAAVRDGLQGNRSGPMNGVAVPMKNTGLYIWPSGTLTQPGRKTVVRKSPVGVAA